MNEKTIEVLIAALATTLPALAQSKISDGVVRIGVLPDMSGQFSREGGKRRRSAQQARRRVGHGARPYPAEDEITEGLAPVIVQKLGEVILQLRTRGHTVILVEQNFRFATPLAERHCVIEHGRIVQTVARAELAEKQGLLDELLGV